MSSVNTRTSSAHNTNCREMFAIIVVEVTAHVERLARQPLATRRYIVLLMLYAVYRTKHLQYLLPISQRFKTIITERSEIISSTYQQGSVVVDYSSILLFVISNNETIGRLILFRVLSYVF